MHPVLTFTALEDAWLQTHWCAASLSTMIVCSFWVYHADDAIKKQHNPIYAFAITLFADFIRPSSSLRFFHGTLQHRDGGEIVIWQQDGTLGWEKSKGLERGERTELRAESTEKRENCRYGWNKREWWMMRGEEARQQNTKRGTSEGNAGAINCADVVKLE